MRKLLNAELNRKTISEFKETIKAPISIILDNIRSLNNVGSIFRTADAFLVESIYLCGITATPPHREIQKTALGATDSVNWEYYKETYEAVENLRSKGYTIIAIEQVEGSISLLDYTPEKTKKYAFIFGHEVRGVEQSIVDISDMAIEIPQFGTKHSFNISVSTGIILWDHFVKSAQKKGN